MQKGPLPGFRDFYPNELAERAHIMRVWREVARRFAFVEYDGPPLEPLDLYTKKSGEEIVGQLYNFEDKGGRQVSLRPEMTPTVARMVAARANALRKPVRWFSMPQLFRYERQQRGRLREHFQLNVDIFGEADVTADAELLAVAVDIMREFGLGTEDVVARVSDRRLLRAILTHIGVAPTQTDGVFAVIDKVERQPREVSVEKLQSLGLAAPAIDELLDLVRTSTPETLRARYGANAEVSGLLESLERYFEHLTHLGVREFVRLDLTIVRGLAYYTGIVFELFDVKGELRAICGGGRYDTLMEAVGGPAMPALGFGMGDVVLGELLRARGLEVPANSPDFWVASEAEGATGEVMTVATLLRRTRASVEYALRPQALGKQKKAAFNAGASYFVVLAPDFRETRRIALQSLTPAEGIEGQGALDELLKGRPDTLDVLLQAIAENPQLLTSID
jgi:histidyl-tRNA synthetase